MSKDSRSDQRKVLTITKVARQAPGGSSMRRLRPRALSPDEAADLAVGLDEDDLDGRIESICLSPVIEDTATLSDAAHELIAFALWLIELERDGWQMVEDAGADAHMRVINADSRKRVYRDDA